MQGPISIIFDGKVARFSLVFVLEISNEFNKFTVTNLHFSTRRFSYIWFWVTFEGCHFGALYLPHASSIFNHFCCKSCTFFSNFVVYNWNQFKTMTDEQFSAKRFNLRWVSCKFLAIGVLAFWFLLCFWGWMSDPIVWMCFTTGYTSFFCKGFYSIFSLLFPWLYFPYKK